MTHMKDKALELALEAWQTSVYGSESHHKAMLLAMTNMAQTLAAQPATVQEPSPFGILFAVEQAIENGDCPMEIEIQFDAYEAERRGKNNGFA